MTASRWLTVMCALAALSACKFDLDSIPSREDYEACIASGAGNCGGMGGNGGNAGTSGAGGTGGSAGVGGTGGPGGTGGVSGMNGSCSGLQQRCDNGNCIPITQLCNGSDDCGDGSDEPPGCGSGGFAGVLGGIGGIGGIAGNIGGIGGSGGNLACGPCPDVSNNPFVSLEQCCLNSTTCGAMELGGDYCADVFAPGVPDAACPPSSIGGVSMTGCCRSDGRCGLDGRPLNLGCIANTDVPTSVGGPYPAVSCGNVGEACRSSNDCPNGQLCSNVDTNTATISCIDPVPGGVPVGGPCMETTDGNNPCASTLCIGVTGECSMACSSPAECPLAPNGKPPLCASFTLGTVNLQFCSTRCMTTDECRPDQTCAIASDSQLGFLTGMCSRTSPNGVPLKRPGLACADPLECASGLCLPDSAGINRCSALCIDGSECPPSLPFCIQVVELFSQPGDVAACIGGP